jgi:hypothetical protein
METENKMEKNNLPYIGYVASFLSGNFLTPLIGAGTKLGQDTNTIKQSKTVDYIRVGALTAVTLDCLLGAPGVFHSAHEFFETGMDVVTIASLYTDLKNYSVMASPIKETFIDAKNALKNMYNSNKTK